MQYKLYNCKIKAKGVVLIMAIDKDKNTQILITVNKEMLQKIEDYQFSNRIKSRTEAIRQLIDIGIKNS